MKTHVIVLAQGRQERMGDSLSIHKQLVPLEACGGAPLLGRTLAQLGVGRFVTAADRVTVVSWHEVHQSLYAWWHVTMATKNPRNDVLEIDLEMTSLLDPGNSSLKGIHRYLETQAGAPRPDRTVVLLGDVVYSWTCLKALIVESLGDVGFYPRCRFAGTSDISPSGGELWGITWDRNTNDVMSLALHQAIEKHPPFTAYQPGQLRRWMWQVHPSLQCTSMYRATADYCMDVDLPEHVPMLEVASRQAMFDDREHGLIW